MKSRLLGLSTALALGLVAMSAGTFAEPHNGGTFPWFRVRDLHDRWHDANAFAAHTRPTFLVVLCSEDASAGMHGWLESVRARYGDARVQIVGLVTANLSRIVPEFIARDQARARTPRTLWATTWLDLYGELADQLGFARGNPVAWAYVLDPQGRVVASVHGAPGGRTTPPIWAALDALTAPHP